MITYNLENFVKELAAQYFQCSPDMVSVNIRHCCDKGQVDTEKQRESALFYPNDGSKLYYIVSSCVTLYNTTLAVVLPNGDISLVNSEDVKSNGFLNGCLVRSVMFDAPDAYNIFRYSYNVSVLELSRI